MPEAFAEVTIILEDTGIFYTSQPGFLDAPHESLDDALSYIRSTMKERLEALRQAEKR